MTTVEVRSEPATYRRDTPVSYYRDLVMRDRDGAAQARLDRHDMETRVNPNTTQGQGGYFAPPGWLNEAFATYPRPGRVLSELIRAARCWFPLPLGVHTVNIPRLTGGTTEAVVPDVTPVPATDIADAATTSPVATLDGKADVALQLLEQSPAGAHLDWAIWKDLSEAYDSQLETQLLYGTGTNKAYTGLTNVVGINAVSVPGSATSLPAVWAYFGQATGQIGDTRNLPPEVWLMRTARWAWIWSSEDDSDRPIMPPAPSAGPGVTLGGWPLYFDDAISSGLSATTGQPLEAVIACRPSDLMLFEGTPTTTVGLEVLSGTLQARITLRNYAAAILGRYPSGIATIGVWPAGGY